MGPWWCKPSWEHHTIILSYQATTDICFQASGKKKAAATQGTTKWVMFQKLLVITCSGTPCQSNRWLISPGLNQCNRNLIFWSGFGVAWVKARKWQYDQHFILSNLLHNSLCLLRRALRTASWIFFSCSLSICSTFPFAVIIEPECWYILLLPLFWSDRSIPKKLLMVDQKKRHKKYYDVNAKTANLFQ